MLGVRFRFNKCTLEELKGYAPYAPNIDIKSRFSRMEEYNSGGDEIESSQNT